jgi:hypothetical protein
MSLQGNLGTITVSTKDQHSQLFNLNTEEFLEAILHKVGRKKKIKKLMIFTLKMIKLGYFLLIIKANSKFSKTGKNMR